MDLPTICHPTDRPNLTEVSVGPIELTYSYRTVIRFYGPGEPRFVVRANDWGPTTGKHLNYCDGGDKAARIPGPEFEARLLAMLERVALVGTSTAAI